ncbi:MAG: ankyrin repeat domain-containing protein [bacterium]|nr:ankyrin repeat domain-containing protein [bacterium]
MHDNILTLLREYPDIFWIRPLAYLIAIFAIILIPYAAWITFKKIKSGAREAKIDKPPVPGFIQNISGSLNSLKSPGFVRTSLFFTLFIVLAGFSLDKFLNVRDIDRMLYKAVGKGNLAEVKELVKKGANIHIKGFYPTLLQNACQERFTSVITFLAEQGLDVNAKDRDGHTPLQSVIQQEDLKSPSKSYEIAVILIKKGADVNVKDKWHDASALHWAVIHNHKELVELLLVNGANPDIKNEKEFDRGLVMFYFPAGTSPLNIAVEKGYQDIVELLIRNGAHADSMSLSIAVKKGDSVIVEFLIGNGAQVDSIDTLGELVDFAAVNGLTDIAEMLKKAKVRPAIDFVSEYR